MHSSNKTPFYGAAVFATVAALIATLAAGQGLSPQRPGASSDPGVIPNRYIVTVDKDELPEAVIREHGLAPRFVFHHAINGFAADFSDLKWGALKNDKRVIAIEPDRTTVAQSDQANPPWELDRIDQRIFPLDSNYHYSSTGAGVTVYVIDSGIRYTHSEFGGRVSFGFDANGGDGTDCWGHGTYVSGIIGGATYGVAKDVNLVAVRVADCTGSGALSKLIAAIDWVTANHVPQAVANMSVIASGMSPALDKAVQNMVFSGVAVSVSAGNFTADACNYSPGRIPDVMTIGNSGDTDTRRPSSDYGSCVDWFAPGYNVPSAWYTDDNATLVTGGTSASTAVNSGVAALYLENHPAATPIQVRDALLSFATKGIVMDSLSPNNHLLFNGEITEGFGDYTSPTTSITSPADGGTVKKGKATTITAAASDNAGVAKVEFYINGGLACTRLTAPFNCVWNVPSVIGWPYVLQTRVYDAAGNGSSSRFVNVTSAVK